MSANPANPANVVPMIVPDDVDFKRYMRESEHRAKVRPAANWRSALERLCDEPHRVTGAKLPWSCTHDNVRFRPGEVTLWAGENGSGKSQLLGFVTLALAAQNERTCIASFEMAPIATLSRMLRQAATTDKPSREFAGRFASWTTGRLWIYDHRGRVLPQQLYAVLRYCADQLQMRHVIIDSLMKCVGGEDDYNGQKDFVHALTVLAADLQMHIHLVHHVRKGDDDREDKPRGKNAIKGSGSIVDQVDQAIIVWRNRPKERAVQQALHRGKDVDVETAKKPDTLLLVEKNRHGEWEGRVPLWYLPESLQYVAAPFGRPIELVGMLDAPEPSVGELIAGDDEVEA
ncbi:DnaB-like helicase C-terminal domain-containing protein [Pigmentiphaga soli]|uniref:DnaB-like helicase C-terminal domain-containing protein n=1 Tax=Pigmentiphaga soli TaxID=1007095 RepID=A0ABP8GCM7_9BURK